MRYNLIIVALIGAAGLMGCQSRGGPPMQIQLCLSLREGDANELKRVFQEIARAEKMDYFDGSAETQRQLEQIDESFDIRKSFPLINIAVRRRDGLGVGGGNAGLPADQVAFGFTSGRDRKETKQFAERVIYRLARTWEVERIPEGQGAFPLDRCNDQRAAR
ncbi:MAG TPA: hypothetical protein VNH53_08430 [Sphingomicrobium sp.]|jgi:hypothetical protein|nr:hypothetical protein [Sphingomicrobium sp.]